MADLLYCGTNGREVAVLVGSTGLIDETPDMGAQILHIERHKRTNRSAESRLARLNRSRAQCFTATSRVAKPAEGILVAESPSI